MMKKAKTYLASIEKAATERELLGIEIQFKQDMTITCDDLGKLCRAAEDKRYTLRNNEETRRLKHILFFRTKAEMDAYHDMSRKPESWSAEEIEHQRIRFCSVWQVIEEAELADEYEAWKEATPQRITLKRTHAPQGAVSRIHRVLIARTSLEVLFLMPIFKEGRESQWLQEAENQSRPPSRNWKAIRASIR